MAMFAALSAVLLLIEQLQLLRQLSLLQTHALSEA